MNVHYQLSLASPHTHEFSIRLNLQNNPESGALLSLPAWIPGSYRIRDFAKQVSDVVAHDANNQPLSIHKTDKQTWQLAPGQGMVQVSYRVYALDISVRTAYFDPTRAYFNGASLLMRVHDQSAQPHKLELICPAFAESTDWRVATSMPALDTDERGFGMYQADHYAALIDHPFEIGRHQQIEFSVQNIHHRMVFSDAHPIDLDRIKQDIEPICAEHAALFGELPIARYVFMVLATTDGYGGLEHHDSTSLICRRADLPCPGHPPDKAYQQFLALCSHEYFHLWHVKRIRPAALMADALDKEAHTELLWAFEGITSYYDELALPRTGRISPEHYLGMLAESVSRLLRNPGRTRQSVAESSFDAWSKFYQQDENSPNAIVSYYTKGALVAFGLDHRIRTQSRDNLSLDDLMRRLWRKYGRTGIGIPERQIENELAEMLQQPVDDFFAAYVYGTTELPLADWFADFGIGYQLRPAQSIQDLGGYPSFQTVRTTTKSSAISLGAKTREQGGLVRIEQVFHGGGAQAAGVAPGDLLIAIDGERCTQSRLTNLLNRKSPGETIRLSLFRRDLLMTLSMQAQPAVADTCELWLLDDAEINPAILRRRTAWLATNR